MSGYKIPKKYLKGFELLSNLNKSEIEKLIAVVSNKSLIGKGIEHLAEELSTVLNKEISNSTNETTELSETIFSFLRLCQDDDVELIIRDLSVSFQSQCPEVAIDKVNFLSDTLRTLADNAHIINLTLKIQDIKLEYPNVYLNSRIMTDIRTVFENSIQNEVQNAIIVHNLKLEFDDDNSEKSIFIALDRNELIDLRYHIDRALEKEEAIRKTKSFNFISSDD